MRAWPIISARTRRIKRVLSFAGNAGYWEVVELGRKLILSGLLGLVGRGSIAQSVAGVMIAFVFFALTFKERPYKSNSLNWIKIFSEFQLYELDSLP